MDDVIVRGMIKKAGTLYIERRGRLVAAVCPFSSTGEVSVKCGEWCPHFGEPIKTKLSKYLHTGVVNRETIVLNLTCGHGRNFYFKKLDDRRVVPGVKSKAIPEDVEPEGGVLI